MSELTPRTWKVTDSAHCVVCVLFCVVAELLPVETNKLQLVVVVCAVGADSGGVCGCHG